MLFNSYAFVIFAIIFFSLYQILRNRLRPQNFLILVGSYIFYGWWDERFLILIMLTTITDYVTALGIVNQRPGKKKAIVLTSLLGLGAPLLSIRSLDETGWTLIPLYLFIAFGWLVHSRVMQLDVKRRRKAFLAISIATNLAILGFFKYFNFFADSLVDAASMLGWQVDSVTLNIVLPVGISFYTFQTMSYTIDVYRGQLKPTRRFIEFAAFLAFFPQLVAGPIERAKHLLPQFFRQRHPSWIEFKSGLWLSVWGLYKKIVIADNLAPITNHIFDHPEAASSGELLAAILAFTFQIYCDFSGYSDTARGISRMLGFDIMVNFNVPYISKTPSEFWRRWHISLSTWLRDYLYISMGGNRCSALKNYRNLTATMVLGGLWHGAAWNFVLWGAYQGLILVVYRLFSIDDWIRNRQVSPLIEKFQNLGLIALMFILTCFGWLLFRAPDAHTIYTFVSGINHLEWVAQFNTIAYYVWPLLAYQTLQMKSRTLEPLTNMPWFYRYNIQLFVLFSLLFLASKNSEQFIYFNF